jgi:ABC-type transport system involved in multi-copper enzyme maturation permease subunit
MPIHEQGYRRYAGTRAPHRRAWWVIARAGILERLRERRFLGLLLLAWAPFVVRAVQMYVSSSFLQASFLAPTADTFREFLDQQSLFLFFVTIYAGSGLIAADRRGNALQIYLAKPVTRRDYVAGKLLILVVFLAAVTWAPAMLLLVLQVMITGSAAFLRENLSLVPAITLFCAVQVTIVALVMLALSSLSKSRRFVAIMYTGFVFFTAAMHQVFRAATGSRAWAWMSPEEIFDTLAAAVFRVPGARVLSLAAACAAAAFLVGASIWILERRVRAVEIVG